MQKRGLYAIVDHVSQDILGILQIHKHEAAAIRMFTDIAAMPNSQVGLHPADYALVRMGWLNDDLTIAPENTSILEGSVWAAAQQDKK